MKKLILFFNLFFVYQAGAWGKWTWPAGWERESGWKKKEKKAKELELDLEMNQSYSYRANLINKEKEECKKAFKNNG